MKLHDQIIAIERATTPNRSLDGDVIELLGLQPDGLKRCARSQPELFRDDEPGTHAKTWLAPCLTRSMDAAAEILSPGWRIASLSDATETVRHRAILERDTGTLKHFKVVGYGCNRATALLAAALRGKAHDRGSPMPRSSEFVEDSGRTLRDKKIHA